MSGDVAEEFGTFALNAGIIPRTLYKLFEALELEKAEHSVKVSFIELYNEELRDLIAPEEDRKVKIYDDSAKKGIVIQGMEETFIKSASEGIRVLQQGSHRRQVAATKCNDLSSRSHSVFTITLHVKETLPGGEEYLRIGKLNLVDLAGSENINRSGAENKRAREAGMINQSLLTLGRVINALVDRSAHVPYRESKLTRLLQDSLGGRTKTCIIATVSPVRASLEETVSTLDYASRAKNIRNKPQMNQIMSKKTLIKEYIMEIERLKGDLSASRQKNGVYITSESYQEIMAESESRRILTEEQQRKIEVIENQLRAVREQFEQNMRVMTDTKKELDRTERSLLDAQSSLDRTERDLSETRASLKNETVLRNAHEITELQLDRVGNELMTTVRQATADVARLGSKAEREAELLAHNRGVFAESQTTVAEATDRFRRRLSTFSQAYAGAATQTTTAAHKLVTTETARLEGVYNGLEQRLVGYGEDELRLKDTMAGATAEMNDVLENIKVLREDIKAKVGEGFSDIGTALGLISTELATGVGDYRDRSLTAFNQLGRDVKALFDGLQKNMHQQDVEIEQLHSLPMATLPGVAQQVERQVAALDAFAREQTARTTADSTALIAKITAAVTEAVTDFATSQNRALEDCCQARRAKLTESHDQIVDMSKEIVDKLSAYITHEEDRRLWLFGRRDHMKQSVVDTYETLDELGGQLHQKTEAIYAQSETIVSAQKSNLAVQMQALDEFVASARAQNEKHHDAYVAALAGMSAGLSTGVAGLRTRVSETGTALNAYRGVSTSLGEQTMRLGREYDGAARKDFAVLRDAIGQLRLDEYVPTGETPKKTTTYRLPPALPRTRPHHEILASMRYGGQPTEERRRSVEADERTAVLSLAGGLASGQASGSATSSPSGPGGPSGPQSARSSAPTSPTM
ncbi:kinesin motor domain-containing protein [Dipodascopsis tothii]|uniref:kinesin motor domain-containing protein n=1 Tax=Dipodascopsis tothii TaxID=44089 RepID=UPI0034CE1C29